MFKLFKTLRNAGTATIKYPFKPLEVAHGFRGKPEYVPEQCTPAVPVFQPVRQTP